MNICLNKKRKEAKEKKVGVFNYKELNSLRSSCEVNYFF